MTGWPYPVSNGSTTGMRERPGDNESSVSWEGKPLPYMPYAYRHPEYWQKIKEASKAGKDMVSMNTLYKTEISDVRWCRARTASASSSRTAHGNGWHMIFPEM